MPLMKVSNNRYNVLSSRPELLTAVDLRVREIIVNSGSVLLL